MDLSIYPNVVLSIHLVVLDMMTIFVAAMAGVRQGTWEPECSVRGAAKRRGWPTQLGKSSNSMRDFPASHGGLDYQIKIHIYIKRWLNRLNHRNPKGFWKNHWKVPSIQPRPPHKGLALQRGAFLISAIQVWAKKNWHKKSASGSIILLNSIKETGRIGW